MDRNGSKRLLHSLLAAELNQMSASERNELLEDIHGVDEMISETEEYVAECLHLMEVELDKIQSKDSYEHALRIGKDYVTGRSFRLMFLRADKFNPARAASRLVRYLDAKKEMFGANTLGRPVYYTDLDSGTKEYLELGIHQVLSERSRSGKLVSVWCCPPDLPNSSCHISCTEKALFYQFAAHVEADEETQKRGYVHVVFFHGEAMSAPRLRVQKRLGPVGKILPVRVTGIHFCAQNGFFNGLERVVLSSIWKPARIRLRFHHGTPSECLESLMTFGIPVRNLAIGATRTNVELNNTALLKWIGKQKVRDHVLKGGEVFTGIDIPSNSDVVLGRGRNYQDHFGNFDMRCLIVSLVQRFKEATKKGRDGLIESVIDDVHSRNGRFLERLKNGWFEVVPHQTAYDKINRSFKTLSSETKTLAGQEEPTFVETMDRSKRARTLLSMEEQIAPTIQF